MKSSRSSALPVAARRPCCGRCRDCISLTSGAILLDGSEITGPHPDIGIVFQEANLLPWRNLDANIHFPFEIKGEKPDRAWIAHLLSRVGLEGFGGKFPRELSGGMQQRAAIVRALGAQTIRPA